MKRSFYLLITAAQLFAGFSLAANFTDVSINAIGIYAPDGFDANDFSEVVVSGLLPNSCYSRPVASAVIEQNQIKVKVKATKSDGRFCLQMVTPFVAVVSVGRLAPAQYEVLVNDTDAQLKSTLKVTDPGRVEIDNFVYAKVESVNRIEGSRMVTLKGTNPSDCVVLDSIKIVSNGVNTFSVLPVMRQLGWVCPQKPVPFEYQVAVPESLGDGEVLLHVRSMDGHSVNFLFEN